MNVYEAEIQRRNTYIDGVTFNMIIDTGFNNIAVCDCDLFCGPCHGTEPIQHLPADATMIDLLAYSKFFPSKGQARKNWTGGVEIPFGYSEHDVGKGPRRQFFYIWKPGPWPPASELSRYLKEGVL